MKKINLMEKGCFYFSVLALCGLLTGCASAKQKAQNTGLLSGQESDKATLYAPVLQPTGRYFVNNRQQLELVSSAVHTGFTFE
jgi:hypothetical protein